MLLGKAEIYLLHSWLPEELKGCGFELIYSSLKDEKYPSTIIKACKGKSNVVVIYREENEGRVFGVN